MQFIADRLKVLRNRKSWSCADLAKRTGLSERTIQRLEAKSPRQATTREKTVKKLAAALGVDSGVLTGAAPLPDDEQPSGPRKPDLGRQRFSTEVSPAARNAYELIRLQYGVQATDIAEMAPLFFVLLAEANFARRQKKLEELREADERLAAIARGHLIFATPRDTGDGFEDEENSIKEKDLFGAKIAGDVYELGYVDERDNPFTGFLREMANKLDDSDEKDELEVCKWENLYAENLPEYSVCRRLARRLAGGDKGLLSSLMFGNVPLAEMPAHLREESAAEERIAWMKEKRSEAHQNAASLDDI